jgi:uncharacterized membrane protein
MYYYTYLYAVLMASIDGVVLTLLKAQQTGLIKNILVFPFSMAVYALQPLIFYSGLSYGSMSILNILWDVISDIIVLVIGIFVFEEKFSLQQAVGMLFCVLGIILLKIGPDSTHPRINAGGEHQVM